MADEPTEQPKDQVGPTEPVAETSEPVAEPTEAPAESSEPVAETSEPVAGPTEAPAEAPLVEETAVEAPPQEPVSELVAEEPVVEEPAVEEPAVEEPAVEEPAFEEQAAEEPVAEEPVAEEDGEAEEEEPAPRVKPSVPGAHLEVDIVPEGVDPLAPERPVDPYAIDEDDEPKAEEEPDGGGLAEPISTAAIDLAAGARYKATGKRKTAIARVILRPGSGTYVVNGRALDEHFPRVTLQRNIRQPLETVGYQERMDVVARLHGGGISAQAGALRHGISRALLEADPNLRGELKRRGFLTRDSRAKERKKAGLKKARKRPQFSKR
jgi:small subunit ribosomal protein S9